MSQNDQPEERQQNVTRRDIFDYLFAFVAVFGAMTGGYATYKELIKPRIIDVKINFDGPNSLFAVINSDEPTTNGKIAIMLYPLVLAGRGQSTFYPRNIDVSIRCAGKSKTISQIRPPKYRDKDSSVEYITI